MKKAFSIFFAIILLVNSINLTLSAHYCGGNLAKLKLVFGDTKLSCGMEEGTGSCTNKEETLQKNCCEDKLQSFCTKDNFLSTTHNFNTVIVPFSIITHATIIPAQLLAVPDNSAFEIPPDIVSVFLPFIRVFRI